MTDYPTFQNRPLGLGARRQVANQIIYRIRKGVQDQYTYVVPANPRTALQQWWRSVCARGVAIWQGFTPAEKDVWRDYAFRSGQYGGFQAFMSRYLGLYTDLLP